jgi:hypothetical protein
MVDKYDEGSDYFTETTTSGWGRWFVKPNGELTIMCKTVTKSSVGGTVCGKESPCKDGEYCADFKLHESCETFLAKYRRQKSLDEIDEEKLRAQMQHAFENLPPSQTQEEEEEEQEAEEYYVLSPEPFVQTGASSQVSQKQGALSSLRRMFSRSKRQRL